MCGSDFAVLEALLHKGPLPVNEIGKKVMLTSGSITVAVDRLETKGLVERRAHGNDRRARIVHLTKEGRKLIKRAYADHAVDLERLASASLSRAERKTLIRLLKKIGYEAAGASGNSTGGIHDKDCHHHRKHAARSQRRGRGQMGFRNRAEA